MGYLGRLAPIVTFFKVADVLIDQTWVFLLLLPILEDLGVLAHLDVQLIITLKLSAFFERTISVDLKVDVPAVIKSLPTACEVVDRSWLDLKAAFTWVARR